MKQVIIADDGFTVASVQVVDEPGPLTFDEGLYVGPGMIWNGSLDAPAFSWLAELIS